MNRLARPAMAALVLVVALGPDAAPAKNSSLAVAMEEVSVFEVMDKVSDFSRGQFADGRPAPYEEVRRYPNLKSQKPTYGLLKVNASRGSAASKGAYHYVVDESKGTGTGYDRLYVDLDCDLDLSNDTPLDPVKAPSGATTRMHPSNRYTFFETLSVGGEASPGTTKPIEVVPRLIVGEGGSTYLTFLQHQVRQGKVSIGGRTYLALLGHPHSIDARFDAPGTGLYFVGDGVGEYGWWGRDTVQAVRRFGDTLYRFSVTPSGDQLTLAPYTGELGVFRVDKGDRTLEGQVTMRGSLSSKKINAAVGGRVEDGWPQPATSCRVPAGDYYPSYLTVHFGPLRIFLSNRYYPRHATGAPGDPAHGIRIRPDVPYVLDFSNKPEVVFVSPSDEKQIKAGTTLKVEALLLDPTLDVMIRGLDDTRRKTEKVYSLGADRTRTVEVDASLDPKVLITRADGERVVEGVMPFG